MDAFLPPATPQQTAHLYAQFSVNHHATAFTHWAEFFALESLALHLAVPWLLLAFGFSANLRECAAQGAEWLLRLGLFAKFRECLTKQEEQQQQRNRGTKSRTAKLAVWNRRMQQRAEALRLWREWNPAYIRTVFLYSFGYALIYRLVRLPFNYGAYRVEVFYGLKHDSIMAWFSSSGSRWLDGISVNTIGTVLLLGLIRFCPRRWPFFLAALFACVAVVFLRLPMDSSSDISAMPGGSHLAQRLHFLAAQAGLPQAHILVDESNEGKNEPNGSASYAGMTPCITLTRKLVDTQPEAQVEAVMAHEIGHCVHQDDFWMLCPTVIAVFAAFPFIRWIAERLLDRFGTKWRIKSLADPAALPLLMLCFHLVTLVTDPLANAYSRAVERRADAYGLALTRERLPAAQQFADFSRDDSFGPAPPTWFVVWYYDHPSDSERIQFALQGQPDAAARHFAKFW